MRVPVTISLELNLLKEIEKECGTLVPRSRYIEKILKERKGGVMQ